MHLFLSLWKLLERQLQMGSPCREKPAAWEGACKLLCGPLL